MPYRLIGRRAAFASLGAIIFGVLSVNVALPRGKATDAREGSDAHEAGIRRASSEPPADGPHFNRDIRPILADACFTCHGPDSAARKAGLRLDQEAAAKSELESGERAIVAGNVETSALLQRVGSSDPDLRMPPPDAHKQLNEKQIRTLREWISAGAKWEGHWSFEPPRRAELPLADAPGAATAIDVFVQQRLSTAKLTAALPADRVTLLRRLSFDLVGLPPSADDVAAFMSDVSPDAVERVADRLLAAPQFGERWAAYWLDLARYGDSCGYHSDNDQSVWPYRDYVIAAFNRDLPFDQFTREQLAGDLLVGSTREQKIATGFNRLNKTTEEGGAQAAEYIEKYAADRVRTTAGAWLGLTLGCAECHDHKYDPITARDFYSFAAFFSDVQETGVYVSGRREPEMLLASDAQLETLRDFDAKLAAIDEEIKAARSAVERAAAAKSDAAAELKAANPKATKAEIAKATAAIRKRREQVAAERKAYERSLPRTLVTVAAKPREMRVLPRGNWMDKTGPVVVPTLPAALAIANAKAIKTANQADVTKSEKRSRLTRLDLAEWIVARDNPLTARVFVNRAWKLLHGVGLSRQLDDVGVQGEWPTHPELLDYLAVEFADDWHVKRLLRQLVATQTYRQSSVPSAEVAAADPLNRLLARQGRWRLDAEMIRDHALHAAGLLSTRMGGPSVKPYQPEGYWRYLNFPARDWTADVGENQYRRGLYTHWQRTFLHPSLLAFDATSREECTAERQRSSTPKAALALLNDPTYVEAARGLAIRILRYTPQDVDGDVLLVARLRFAWSALLSREPAEEELAVIRALYIEQREHYAKEADAAAAVQTIGQLGVPADVSPRELAPWVNVARAILNLQETTTRN